MTQIWRLDSLLVLPLLADNPPCLNSAYSSFTASITTSPSIGISFFSVSLEIKSFLDVASGSMLARELIFARLWPKDNRTSLRSIPAKDLTGARGEFNKFKLNLWNLEKMSVLKPWWREKTWSIRYVLVSKGKLWMSLQVIFQIFNTFWDSLSEKFHRFDPYQAPQCWMTTSWSSLGSKKSKCSFISLYLVIKLILFILIALSPT